MIQIVFENRFKEWNGTGPCFITIDGTDVPIKEQWPYNPIWWSHKHNGPGLRYEFGICIATGDIVWVSGPWPAAMKDLEIFDLNLSTKLLPGEKVEADSGYGGRDQIATPQVARNSRHRKQKSQARGRHENVNARVKMFKILAKKWQYDIESHRKVMMAILVTLQIGFELGERLYEVEYDAHYD